MSKNDIDNNYKILIFMMVLYIYNKIPIIMCTYIH